MVKVTTTTSSTDLRSLLTTAGIDANSVFTPYGNGHEYHYEITLQNTSWSTIYVDRWSTATSSTSYALANNGTVTLQCQDLSDITLLASATTKDLIVI